MLDIRPKCFVLMSFTNDLANVYSDAIRTAAESQSFICERADEIMDPGVVLEQIDERIEQASVIIVDLTHLNPNVLQEYGFARRAGKQIILITQDRPSSLPFDVRHYRIIPYLPTAEGLAQLRGVLERTLLQLQKSAFSSQPDAPREFLTVTYEWYKKNIEPQLVTDGYNVVEPAVATADQYRLEGWEYVTYVDPHDHKTKIIRTRDLIPLKLRR